MAGQVRMTPDMMDRRAGECENLADKIQSEILSGFRKLVGALNEEWEGNAQAAFNAKYEGEIRPHFQNAEQYVRDVAKALHTQADNIRRADEAGQRTFS